MRRSSLLLLLCLAGAARADNAADEADVAFSLGNRAYAKGDFPQALSSYFLSYRLVPNRNVLFNIARCYEALKSYDEAYRYYNDLAAAGVAGEDRAEIDQAMARLKAKVALVRVTTEPAGADVFVDREDLGSRGRSPQTLALAPGKHRVVVKLEGFRPAETSVAVERGRETAARFDLKLIVGNVHLAGTAGAQLRETPDGPVVGTVPGALQLAPGKHIFYASAPGYVSAPFLVDVAPEGTAELKVLLAEQPKSGGKLLVTANRESALVKVDGNEAGFTPTVLTLAEGEHEVEVSYRDLRPVHQRVSIVKDQEVKLAAELRYAPPPVQAASKKLLAVDEAPASVTVVTAEEIRAFGYTTLPQALSAIRGLYTVDDRQYSYLGVRGFAPPGDYNTRVLILWDGHSMNDVWAGQGYLGRELAVDLDEVDHIEIVRGPASALYGTGAFFAVINIVTRQALAGRHVEATGAAGSLSSWGAHAAAGGELGPASGVLSGAAYGAAGADTTNLGAGGAAAAGYPVVLGLDQERAFNGHARARWGDFSLSAFLNSRTKNLPTASFGTTPNAAGTKVTDLRGFVEGRWEHDFANGANAAVRLYFDASQYKGFWNYGTSDAPSLESDAGGANWVGGEARGRLKLFGANQLTLGVDSQVQLKVYQDAFGGPDKAPLQSQTRNIVAAYAFDEWQLLPQLFFNLALRVDKYSDLKDPQITPRLAIIARPYRGGLTKLVAGQAFRAPNVYESYYDDNGETQLPACTGSPCTLKPETILTAELEHSHDLTEELRVTVAAYTARIENLIILGTDPGGAICNSGPCILYQNTQGLLHAAGAEAEVRWQPGRFALVDLSYSYVRVSGAGGDFTRVLAGTPNHLAAGRLMLPLVDPFVRLAASAVYQSARVVNDPTGAYPAQYPGEALLLGVGLSGELEHLRYFAGVNNLLDVRYVLPSGVDYGTSPPVPQYGRTFQVRLTGTY